MEPFIFLIVLFFLLPLIIAFVAFSEVRAIRSTLRSFPLNELTSRIYHLEQKLAQLQKQLDSASAQVLAAPSAPPPPEPHAAPESPRVEVPIGAPSISAPKPIPTQPPPAPPVPRLSLPTISDEPSAADLESLIGGRWFNRIGIIALLFAISYFLKLAFDNNWIGPAGRVAIGIVLGLLMLPWSDWLLGHGYTYFSEGIAGLGEATLFVSVWAGCQYYTLFSRQIGFVALVVVTVVMAFLALRRDSERIAFLSLLGGLLTPVLMSTGRNQQVILFSYLLLLGAAALFVSWRKNWRSLLPLAFGGTILYFWEWYDSFYTRSGFLGSTLIFATLIFLLYAVVPAARALLRQALRVIDVLLVFVNVFAYIAALYTMLWPGDRWPLALLFIGLAIAHEAIALLLPDPNAPEASTPRVLYTGLAVACFTLAIPTKLEHNVITLALAVEGAVLIWTGFRFLGSLLRPFGYFLLSLAAIHFFVQPPAAGTFLFNQRFGTYLVFIAALAVALWSAFSYTRLSPAPSFRAKRGISLESPGDVVSSSDLRSPSAEIAFLTITINFFSVLALSQEFWDFFGSGPRTIGNSLAQHLSLSVLWTIYAALLLLLGVQRQLPLLRWQALILLGIVVLKVFFYDLSFLDRVYRIFSFFILGAALLAVSFFYQRKLARSRSTSQ